METLKPDYSTINKSALHRLPVYKCPPTYRIDDERDMGSGCAGDPPGFPSYFLRSIYTQYGNSPGFRNYPQEVIKSPWGGSFRVVLRNWSGKERERGNILLRLWVPLPLDHPRTRAWIEDNYRHHAHCYLDPHLPEEKGWHGRTIIYPVPYYKLATFKDDPRFSDEWRQEERSSVERKNHEIETYTARIAADPANHSAVIIIRSFYPDYKPEVDLINNPPQHISTWWKRLSRRPLRGECPGDHGTRHPVNGSWCQVCGWRGDLPAPEPEQI